MTLGPHSIVIKSDLYRLYLFYHFSGYLGQYQMDGIKGGCAQPKANKTDFRSLVILKPSEDLIRAIYLFAQKIESLCFVNDAETINDG